MMSSRTTRLTLCLLLPLFLGACGKSHTTAEGHAPPPGGSTGGGAPAGGDSGGSGKGGGGSTAPSPGPETTPGSATDTASPGTGAAAPAAGDASGGGRGVPPGDPGTQQPAPQAGQLTAGAWDDNLNFDFFKRYLAAQAQLAGRPPFTDDEHAAAAAKFGPARTAHTSLDIAFVIDTTGSMGDEIAYVKAEVRAIADTIAARHPEAPQRWALVVYRDLQDDYLTRTFDFTSDIAKFQSEIDAQSADGGGDYPESPDAALAASQQLSWSSGSAARMLFWVADAPHHDDKAAALATAVRGLAGQDVHIYPVSASGTDELLELTMRSAAQLTGGRYLFLTNDSGIGDNHKEPSIPCYFVTLLKNQIIRMVSIELTGTYQEPATDDIIRTSGQPMGGHCQTSTQQVNVF